MLHIAINPIKVIMHLWAKGESYNYSAYYIQNSILSLILNLPSLHYEKFILYYNLFYLAKFLNPTLISLMI